jgi:hypothetical protein
MIADDPAGSCSGKAAHRGGAHTVADARPRAADAVVIFGSHHPGF